MILFCYAILELIFYFAGFHIIHEIMNCVCSSSNGQTIGFIVAFRLVEYLYWDKNYLVRFSHVKNLLGESPNTSIILWPETIGSNFPKCSRIQL